MGKRTVVLSTLLIIVCVVLGYYIRNLYVPFNNQDDYYELISKRYTIEELEHYERYHLMRGRRSLADFKDLFCVECARKISENFGYIVLLDENEEPWLFFIGKPQSGGNKYEIWGVHPQARFFNSEYVVSTIRDNPSSEIILEEFKDSRFVQWFGRTAGNRWVIYCTDGLIIINVITDEEIDEMIFVSNEELKDGTGSIFTDWYIMDIDRKGE